MMMAKKKKKWKTRKSLTKKEKEKETGAYGDRGGDFVDACAVFASLEESLRDDELLAVVVWWNPSRLLRALAWQRAFVAAFRVVWVWVLVLLLPLPGNALASSSSVVELVVIGSFAVGLRVATLASEALGLWLWEKLPEVLAEKRSPLARLL